MGITIVIVGGLVIMTVIALVGDYMSKKKQVSGSFDPKTLAELQTRVETLETQVRDDASRMARLEGEVAFTTKLLEGKSAAER